MVPRPKHAARPRTCRICGCTEDNACLRDGRACSWVAPDICSACAIAAGLAALRPAEPRALRDVVRDHIIAVVAYCGGERQAAARILKISKWTVSHKLADAAAAGFDVPPPRHGGSRPRPRAGIQPPIPFRPAATAAE